MISDLKKHFPQYIIGYSDHTLPNSNMSNLTTAYLLGAKVIEKHFTHNKKLKETIITIPMDTRDLKSLSKNIKHINTVLGSIGKKFIEVKSNQESLLEEV